MTGGGGGGETTTVQKADPWSGVQPYLLSGFNEWNNLWGQGGPEYYPGQTFVERDPLESAGQGYMMDYAMQEAPGQIWDAQKAQFELLNAMDVANNPYVQGMIDVGQNRLLDNLTLNMLPEIKGGALQAGAVGSSRQGVAEGIAMKATQQEMENLEKEIMGEAYSRGMTGAERGLAFAPQTMQMGLFPGQQMMDAGTFLRSEQELGLDDAMGRWGYEVEAPYTGMEREMALYSGAPWGSTTEADVGDAGGGALGGAIGGGALGYGLSTAVPALGPYGIPLAIGGAILGGLFS